MNFKFQNGTNKIRAIILCDNALVYTYNYWSSICVNTSYYYWWYQIQTTLQGEQNLWICMKIFLERWIKFLPINHQIKEEAT